MLTMHDCEAGCGRWFRTVKGMNMHLKTAKSCAWYLKGKLREIGEDSLPDAEEPGILQSERRQPSPDSQADATQDDFFQFDGDFSAVGEPEDNYRFLSFLNDNQQIPEDSDAFGQAGPGPSTAANRLATAAGVPYRGHRVLDDDDDD